MIKQEKPFLTVTEQVDLLIQRGMIVYDKKDAERFLIQNNYYSIVNGYKDIFIDKAGRVPFVMMVKNILLTL